MKDEPMTVMLNTIPRAAHAFRDAILVAGFLPPVLLLRAWVLTVIWGWYIVPAFGVQPLRVVFAFGILIIVTGFIRTSRAYNDKLGWSSALKNFAHPMVTLAFGWIGTFFV